MHNIRTSSLLVLSSILILLAGTYLLIFVQQQKQHHRDLIHCQKKSAMALIQNYAAALDRRYHSRLVSFAANQTEIINAFARRDRQHLYRLSGAIYELLRGEDSSMTQMAFFLPDNTAFLRVHKPDEFGDDLTDVKPVLSEVGRLKQPLSGFEVGRMGLYFHVAQPLLLDNQWIGTLVLGIQSDQLLAKLKSEMNLNSSVLLIKKEAAKITLQQEKHFLLEDSVLYPGEDAFFARYGSRISTGFKEQQLRSDDRVSLIFPVLDLEGVQGQSIGSILAALDITDSVQKHRGTLLKVVLLTLFFLAAGGIAVYVGFTTLLNRVVQLNRSLEEKNTELQQAGEKLEKNVQERTAELASTNENLQQEMQRRKISEASLFTAVEEWQRTFDAIKDPVLILAADLSIVKGNAASLTLFNLQTGADIEGKKCHELFAGSDQICRKCPALESLKAGKGLDQIIEHPFLGKVFQVSCVPVIKEGELAGYVHTSRDITHLRRLEQQLVQAQKMEAIATLAGGIAHDFNNILGAILGNADLLLYRLPKVNDNDAVVESVPPTSEEIVEHVDSIKRAGLRAKGLVKQIVAFSRQTVSRRQRVIITPVVKEGVKLLRSSLPSTIDIKTEISSDIGPVEADPTQIHQILMNLATNAAQALGKSPGRITVGLQEKEIDENFSRKHPDLTAGTYVILSVNDTGHGIPESMRKRIFDPFFTTRDIGEGTGMGLSVIHGIVVSHGGAIVVESKEGEGAEFSVFLPRVADNLHAEADVITNMPRGNETILFVDDEEDIVKMRGRMLEYLGYKVIPARSGEEALALFKQQEHEINLVITDQTMPKMTGLTLAEEIKKINNTIPIILCSGYSEAVTADEARKAGIRRFLAKPLDMRQLSIAIRELLPTGGD